MELAGSGEWDRSAFLQVMGFLPGLPFRTLRYNLAAIHYESRDVLADLIKKYLINSAGVDPEKFKDLDLKVADLGLDSLGLVEMLFEVEDKFGFQIPEPMAFLPMSFAEMVASIDDMVRAQSNQNLQKTDTAS
jgi:acyl carrier protein